MSKFQSLLADPKTRAQIVSEAKLALDEEVASRSGIMGIAIKGGYGVIKTIKPSMIEEIIDKLLDPFVGALEPFVAEHAQKHSGTPLKAYLMQEGERVTEALLAITDEKAAHTDQRLLQSTYQKLRPMAVKNVIQAMPRVSELISKYA